MSKVICLCRAVLYYQLMQLVLKSLANFQPNTSFLGVCWYLPYVLIVALDCLYPFYMVKVITLALVSTAIENCSMCMFAMIQCHITIASNATNDLSRGIHNYFTGF